MRIFTQYILSEVTGYALLGLVLFLFILFMPYLLPLLELTVRGVTSPGGTFRLVGYLLPKLLTMALPMAVLVGILLGLSRLAADSEVTAMRASGVGVVAIVRIVSVLSIAGWLLGLLNSLYLTPRSSTALLRFEENTRGSGASIAVQPRVFYEDFRNFVLYVGDVVPGANGTALWRRVFLADLTQPASPHIVTAEEAAVVGGTQTLRMQLLDGSRHDTTAANPNQYDISTFASTDLPVQTGQQEEETHLSRRDTPLQAMTLPDLWHRTRNGQSSRDDRRVYAIELHRRVSFPTACLVLMLIGVPLGLSSKRGGKGAGFVLTLMLVFLYYFLSSVGIALARQGKLPAFAGVWGANVLFALAGLLLIQQMSRGGAAVNLLSEASMVAGRAFQSALRKVVGTRDPTAPSNEGLRRLRRMLHSRFPLIIDEYVMGSFLRNFGMVLVTFTVLFLVFTFFELVGDIIRFRTPLVTVGDYLLNLIPFVLYNLTPLCSLLAVLITFSTLSRSSELTAMKATGVSLYRVITPVLLVAAMLAAALFAFDELYLPQANRRQEALLSSIKGKPAQTFLRPDRKWMSGQIGSTGEPGRIFYYQFFDPDRNVFANLTVFEFEPGTFAMTRRVFAESAHWDESTHTWELENGWARTFSRGTVESYGRFAVRGFAEIHEPPSYFKKEERPSQEMSFRELSAYIRDLRQSGFDTMRLRVQLQHKLAYPLLTLVMAVLAVPFSVVSGKRGGLAGISAAVGLAIVYWVVANVFENLGNVNSLPAVLAAWSPDILFATAGTYLLLRTPT